MLVSLLKVFLAQQLSFSFSNFQVMYFSSVFPYVVLFIFLIRGSMLDGAMEGVTYMFYPKVSTVFIMCLMIVMLLKDCVYLYSANL